MTIVVPQYADPAVPLERIASALWQVDQFDDWLPDPVHYADRINRPQETLQRVNAVWKAGTIEAPRLELLVLPRSNGVLAAAALPIEARILAHAVITNMAPRIRGGLPRDKVYGFRFLQNGPKVFDSPGNELGQVFDIAAKAARATRDGSFEVLDVAGFNANVRPQKLVEILMSCGARADEANFIRELVAREAVGVPSVDDALAFVYNYYLQPVDVELMRSKRNFFRYRDEYFVFDAQTRQAVAAGLARLGLAARRIGESGDVRGQAAVRPALIQLPHGSFGTQWIRGTDRSELVFERWEPGPQTLFELSPEAPIDAVTALPVLRLFNKQRSSGVLLAPPFGGETAEYATYRRLLGSERSWLRQVLATGAKSQSWWQLGWSATLLSDIGPLHGDDVLLLQGVLSSPAASEACKCQLRVALARSSSVETRQLWPPAETITEFRRRAALLAARHLAHRESAVAWHSASGIFGPTEPELVQHLVANIRERS